MFLFATFAAFARNIPPPKGVAVLKMILQTQFVERMGEFLKSECPHCGQAIEYPPEGTGQTVPCPTCEEPFVLKSVVVPESEILQPPHVAPLPPPVPSKPPPATPAAPAPAKLAPPAPPVTKPILSTPVAAEAKAPGHAPHGSKHSSHSHAGRLDQACGEFASDRDFEKLQPTREQIARALAAAKFKQTSEAEWPTHAELVAALRELFPEFRKRSAVPKTVVPPKK